MNPIQLICKEWVGNSGLSESDEQPTCLSDKERKITSVYQGESSSDFIQRRRLILNMLLFLFCYQSGFPPTLVFTLSSILYYLPPISTVHVQIQIYGTDTCPISPSPKALGVVVKVGKQGSVSCRTLNVLAAAFSQIFPCLSLSFSFLMLILFRGVAKCITFRWLIIPFLLALAYPSRSSSLG